MSDNRPVRRFFAYTLMAVGGLITALCGGCTLVFLWTRLLSPFGSFVAEGRSSAQELFNNFMQVVIIGSIAIIYGSLPTVVAIALVVIGRGMVKYER